MAITAAQKNAIEEILNILYTTTPPRSKRQMAGMFLELVDRTDWPHYYEVRLRPQSFNNPPVTATSSSQSHGV
jgi:chromatin structure-remodeling complex subunit RSC1/2